MSERRIEDVVRATYLAMASRGRGDGGAGVDAELPPRWAAYPGLLAMALVDPVYIYHPCRLRADDGSLDAERYEAILVSHETWQGMSERHDPAWSAVRVGPLVHAFRPPVRPAPPA